MEIPVGYTPRSYQMPFLKAMDSGTRRACVVWHRRSGKTKTLLNFSIKKAFERVGTYFHCFPEYGQGRKIIWDGIDKEGHRVLDYHVPEVLRKSTNKQEMKIELISGSVYQIIGADNYNSLVGPNPVGLILDEWAVSDRYKFAWDYFRPILVENGGWAVFPFTPRGRNHGWDIYQMAVRNEAWFCQLLTIEDTGSISREAIEEERKAGMDESMVQQEFYCSFLASTENILIPFMLIQEALKRDVQYPMSGRVAGLDVARYGNDRNGFVIRQGGQIIHAEVWGGQDLVFTAGKVVQHYRNKMFDCVAIDTIGLGAGVYDMVKNAKVPCVAVNVAEASRDDRFPLLRDRLWWLLREWFEEGQCSISAGIPEKERNALISDIQDIHYKFDLKNRIKIESKDEMKERLKFSPDVGDALCNTLHPEIELKLQQVHRSPFGVVQHNSVQQSADYDPLTFGMEVVA